MARDFLNDRARLELMLPSTLMRRVTEGFQGYDLAAGRTAEAAALDAVLACFREAERDPVAGLPAERAGKLLRRAERIEKDVLADYEGNTLAGVFFALVKLFQGFEADGILVIGDGPFRDGYEALAEGIGRNPDCMALLDDVERSATKMARHLLERLRTKHDLYRPAPGAVAA